MNIRYSRSSTAAGAFALLGLVVGCTFLAAPAARADGYSECNQILSQDIFNKVIKKDTGSSTSEAESRAAYYQQSETEAFDAYKNARKEAKKNGTKIDTEFHYGIIGGELGIDVNSESELSENAFGQKFNRAKKAYASSNYSKTSSSQSLVNSYASYVRDPGTVNAWKECVTRTRETNIYAFASRDPAGKVFINVMWVPGPLAGTLPSIHVSFVTDGDSEGVTVHANPEEVVAAGSGRNFAISCGEKCSNGFQVVVNGTLRNADGGATSSFTSTVDVPPLTPLASKPADSMVGSWRHVLSNADIGTQTEKIIFTPKGDGAYDMIMGSAREASKGIAKLTGNQLQANFETPISGSIGKVTWEMNPTFTEGAGTIELRIPNVENPPIIDSRIFRIE